MIGICRGTYTDKYSRSRRDPRFEHIDGLVLRTYTYTNRLENTNEVTFKSVEFWMTDGPMSVKFWRISTGILSQGVGLNQEEEASEMDSISLSV